MNLHRRLMILAGASLLVLAGCGRRDGGTSAANELRVGMDLDYPPFEMQDKHGKPDGISVELAKALAASLGRPLRIVPMEFSGLVPALRSGNIDLVISSMTANDERRKSIDFSDPYAWTSLALLVGKASTVTTVDALDDPNRCIAVIAGTTGEAWAARHLASTRRVVFEDPAACVAEVSQGRADAFIYDALSIHRYAARHPQTTRVLKGTVAEESWAVGIAKGNDALRQDVNAFLGTFRADGGFKALADRWLQEEQALFKNAGIPFLLR
jgi:polar amino acid transport system substrate-binding protein